MLIVDSVKSWPTVDDGSILRRMCTTRLQRAMTLVLGRTMLPRRAPLLPHTTTTKTLTWASTSTQLWMCCRSLRMLPTPSILHRPCRVNEHDNLRAVSLHDLVSSFITNAVIIIYYLTLVVSLWRRLGQSSWCSELIIVVDKLWTLWTCEHVVYHVWSMTSRLVD
jgi:hypothetical protein